MALDFGRRSWLRGRDNSFVFRAGLRSAEKLDFEFACAAVYRRETQHGLELRL
jgi:hypothetical protein